MEVAIGEMAAGEEPSPKKQSPGTKCGRGSDEVRDVQALFIWGG